MDSLNELIGFLKTSERLDIRSLALHHVLSLTGNFESRKMLVSNADLIPILVQIAFDEKEQKSMNKDAFFALINLSADELDAKRMLTTDTADLVKNLLVYILNENSKFSDTACAILSNLSRGKSNSEFIFEKYFTANGEGGKEATKFTLEKLLQVFCTENFNKTNRLDYLAPFICNLTQLDSVRDLILNDAVILQRLLPYTTYKRSIIRRGGIIGAIKNLCFNYDSHEKLLFSPDIDLLSRLLLPLAGPEEFEIDETEKLPDDLQYLPPEKEREEDGDVRIMLIEALMILCSKKECRKYITDKNTYLILRELHKWEKDEQAKQACEKLVQILISDEPTSDMENLHQVVLPEELSKKFYEIDKKELEKNFN